MCEHYMHVSFVILLHGNTARENRHNHPLCFAALGEPTAQHSLQIILAIVGDWGGGKGGGRKGGRGEGGRGR